MHLLKIYTMKLVHPLRVWGILLFSQMTSVIFYLAHRRSPVSWPLICFRSSSVKLLGLVYYVDVVELTVTVFSFLLLSMVAWWLRKMKLMSPRIFGMMNCDFTILSSHRSCKMTFFRNFSTSSSPRCFVFGSSMQADSPHVTSSIIILVSYVYSIFGFSVFLIFFVWLFLLITIHLFIF